MESGDGERPSPPSDLTRYLIALGEVLVVWLSCVGVGRALSRRLLASGSSWALLRTLGRALRPDLVCVVGVVVLVCVCVCVCVCVGVGVGVGVGIGVDVGVDFGVGIGVGVGVGVFGGGGSGGGGEERGGGGSVNVKTNSFVF